jgi:hypothetical protein
MKRADTSWPTPRGPQWIIFDEFNFLFAANADVMGIA